LLAGESVIGVRMQKPKEWTGSEKEMLVKLARRGVGVSKIAAELGRYAGSVRRMARSLGLTVKK
jgi:hypothetical protein